METLEKLIYDLYKKNARQCTDEEIYNALLIYTKNQLFERGYQDGKRYPAAMRGITINKMGRIMNSLGAERMHTTTGNMYKLVALAG